MAAVVLAELVEEEFFSLGRERRAEMRRRVLPPHG